jgi:hypothetical protein
MDHEGNENPERLWSVVRDCANPALGHKIVIGDVLKLGRVRVKVKDMHPQPSKGFSKVAEPASPAIPPPDLNRNPSNTQFPCRICYSE